MSYKIKQTLIWVHTHVPQDFIKYAELSNFQLNRAHGIIRQAQNEFRADENYDNVNDYILACLECDLDLL